MNWRILTGDVRERLRDLDAGSVQTCVTSPPYWGLRDYGTAKWDGGDVGCSHAIRSDPRIRSSTLGGGKATTGHQREGYRVVCARCGARRIDSQIGLEPTPDTYVQQMVDVFREVRRVLKDDGTAWLNLGDSYAGGGFCGSDKALVGKQGSNRGSANMVGRSLAHDCKPKDLVGIPWRVAFALQADGWYLRSDIIWSKPNPMPESVTDRPTKAHEYIFLLSKRASYYYDAEAIKEGYHTCFRKGTVGGHKLTKQEGYKGLAGGTLKRDPDEPYGWARDVTTIGRNKRSVWHVATQPYPEAHFATFPEALIEPCVLAGSRIGDTVFDPFCGSGTTGAVAIRHQRNFVGVELNPAYVALARARIGGEAPLFATEHTA